MTERKKTKGTKKKENTAKRTPLFAPVSKNIEESPTIRLLAICFTLLSLAFAAMAFWKYPLN